MRKIFPPICILFLSSIVLAQMVPTVGPTKLSCGPAAEITVNNLTLNDSAKLSSVEKETIIHDIESRGYRCDSVNKITQRVRQAYAERGYFKALPEEPVFKVIRQNGRQYQVDVALSIEAGQQYKLKDISFTGATAFPAPALRDCFLLEPGDVFNTEKIRTGLENLRKLYDASGYVEFTPVP